MTPTQRTIARAKELGFTVGKTEHWNSFARIRQDLFEMFDLILVHADLGIIGVQVTSGSNHAARINKILANPITAIWLAAGGKIEVWSWSKKGERGQRKLWTLRREEVKA